MNSSKNLSFILLLFITFINAQYINVNTSFTANDLVDKLIGTNNTCLSVSNVSVTGYNSGGIKSYGYVNANSSGFEISEGILLTFGDAANSPGSFTGIQSFGNNSGWNGDNDLETAAGISSTTNATILEFDFIPNTNKISFDYMFLSEQYLRQGDPGTCGYTDGFAFLIKKTTDTNYKNLALVPNTNIPITSETVRGPGGRCQESNSQYFGHYNPNGSPTSFNGQTAILTAETDVIPGTKYHIKLVIADQGNGLYDSGVILKAGSFVGSKDLGPDRLISTNNPLCEGSTLTLDATVFGATYQWYQNGNILTGETSATYTVTSEGRYEVNISSSSCNLRGSITIEYIEKAKVAPKTFTNCDTNFDGNIPIKLDDLNATIITNYKPEFVVKYYQNLTDATLGNANTLPNNWSYNTDTTIYVRVENGVCAPEIQPIQFIFGNKISVTNYSTTICDGDFNNTEAVNLATYLPQLTSETGYTHQFYLTKNDADLEQNPIASSQNLTAATTFYVRIKKSGICDNIAALTLNFGQPNKSTTLPAQVTVCEGSTTILDAGTGFSSYLWSNGATTQTITVGKGDYSVVLTSPNSCTFTQNVKVVESPKAIVDISKFNTTICDQNLDGTIEVNLNNVTSAILLNPGIYSLKYYANATDANAGNANVLNTSWSFSTDTTIFVRVESDYCPAQIYPLDFKFGNRVTVLTSTLSQEVCDDDLDAIKSVNLKTFESFFTTDSTVSITYFNSENDAKNNVNPISSTQNITSTGTYFLRFEKTNSCPNWAKITVNIKTPKASTSLQNVEICKDATYNLDAGTGFDSYKWSTGETSQTVTKGIGEYYVDLESNGCIYRQNVKIIAASEPTIDSVIEQGNSITVNVSGGTAPYEYSLDQINWQTTNIFYNLNRGVQKVYVRDNKKCTIKEYEFSIIKLLNAITPNGDGLNDTLDYSDLRVKKEVKILIFDRFGKKIFSNENSTSYIWDGTENGRPLPSGSYWYILEWTEPDTGIKINNKGWILLKNRN
ncbi:choice-of-anchor L domain-containing protein [Cloacibacterium caeni]|uniref:choice-of-anchor L domain-containing protein n=1 Tax=Cloacibacterium caeni TaxID=2004710 RepID=UPI001BCD2F00|nr:choice-of-anchor L domain-containing protein [Cloacibacterium caeni]